MASAPTPREAAMLETLYDIDWSNVGDHVYGSSDEIPEAIHNLLSDNDAVREHARLFLFGGQQDTGDIYDSTPYIIPFIIELLADDSTPERDQLLRGLASNAGQIA